MNENYVKLELSTTINGMDYHNEYIMSKELLMDAYSRDYVKNAAEVLYLKLLNEVGTLLNE